MFGLDSRSVSRRWILAAAALGFLLWVPARAASPEPDTVAAAGRTRSAWKKRWVASWLAVAAVNALDVHSSLGQGEANPLYRGRDGRFAPGKTLALKSAIAGGMFLTQVLLLRNSPDKNLYKPFTLANGVTGGALGAVAVHNYRLPAPRPPATRLAPAHLAP